MQVPVITSTTNAYRKQAGGASTGNNFAGLLSQAATQASSKISTKTPDSGNLLQPLFRHSTGNFISIEDIRAETREARSDFQSRLKKLFAENNIDTSVDITLESALDGRVIVTNPHPDKDKIEKFFQDPDLTNSLAKVSALESLLKHAEEAIAFQAAYARNPVTAVAQFSHLFSKTYRSEYSMVISTKGGQLEFFTLWRNTLSKQHK